MKTRYYYKNRWEVLPRCIIGPMDPNKPVFDYRLFVKIAIIVAAVMIFSIPIIVLILKLL